MFDCVKERERDKERENTLFLTHIFDIVECYVHKRSTKKKIYYIDRETKKENRRSLMYWL